MSYFWQKNRIGLILVFGGLFVVLVLYFWHESAARQKAEELTADTFFTETANQESATPKEQPESSGKTAETAEIIIDIKGAVRKPGIYRLSSVDRVSDAINKAGGFSDKADANQLNLAQKVTDEMVIYVPEEGEKNPPNITHASGNSADSDGATAEETAKVNINTADEQELQNLPGVGPAKAKAILTYREDHGAFQSVDELTEVSGIGDKSLEQMRPMATVQ